MSPVFSCLVNFSVAQPSGGAGRSRAWLPTGQKCPVTTEDFFAVFRKISFSQETASNKSSSSSSVLHDMFATDVQMENVCSRCGKRFSRTTSEMNFPLIYPPSSSSPPQALSLASLIPESLCRKQQTHMWCDECTRYRPTVSIQYVNLLLIVPIE